MLSTGVFQNTTFLVASLKVNNFFNNCSLILQIQSNESLHKREIMMCRRILISCKEKKFELIEDKCKLYFRTEVVLKNKERFKNTNINASFLLRCIKIMDDIQFYYRCISLSRFVIFFLRYCRHKWILFLQWQNYVCCQTLCFPPRFRMTFPILRVVNDLAVLIQLTPIPHLASPKNLKSSWAYGWL